jgi:hypothetical protein
MIIANVIVEFKPLFHSKYEGFLPFFPLMQLSIELGIHFPQKIV